MRILFFIDSLQAGGRERQFTELLKGLRNRPNVELRIVVMDRNIHYREILDLGIKIDFLIRSTRWDFSIFRKLYRLTADYAPDIIHSWGLMTSFYALPIAKLRRVKLLDSSIRDAEPATFPGAAWWLRQLVFRGASGVTGNSRAGLTAYGLVPGGKYQVVYNGIDLTRFVHPEQPEKIRAELGISARHVVGMAATFSRFKDYASFFTAAEKVRQRRQDVVFVAVGGGPQFEEWKNKLQGRDGIVLTGRRGDVENLLNIFDVAVLASFREGISNAVMEYMALAKPVIVTGGGGTSELVENERNGFLLPSEKPELLAEKIVFLLDHPEVRTAFGARGRELINSRFELEKMVAGYEAVYREMSA